MLLVKLVYIMNTLLLHTRLRVARRNTRAPLSWRVLWLLGVESKDVHPQRIGSKQCRRKQRERKNGTHAERAAQGACCASISTPHTHKAGITSHRTTAVGWLYMTMSSETWCIIIHHNMGSMIQITALSCHHRHHSLCIPLIFCCTQLVDRLLFIHDLTKIHGAGFLHATQHMHPYSPTIQYHHCHHHMVILIHRQHHMVDTLPTQWTQFCVVALELQCTFLAAAPMHRAPMQKPSLLGCL